MKDYAPDTTEQRFARGVGEFNVKSDEAFEKHLARLERYKQHILKYARENKINPVKHYNKIMAFVMSHETMWYGGPFKIIYRMNLYK